MSRSSVATTAVRPPAGPEIRPAGGPGAFQLEAFDVLMVEGSTDPFLALRPQIADLLGRYLNLAVLAPLRSGEPAGDLSTVFGSAAAARVSGPDRAALVDEGMPKATDVRVDKATASVALLVGPGGDLGATTAGIWMMVKGSVGSIPLSIQRTGELQLTPEGDTWKISGYDVKVSRDTPDGSTTTAAR